MATPSMAPQGTGTSLSDLLTAVKNLVVALNGATQAYRNVNGISSLEGITTATVVKPSAGRVASVVVLVAGSAPGAIYDSASAASQTGKLWSIPNATQDEPYVVNLPADSGILVVPGTGQTVSLSWS